MKFVKFLIRCELICLAVFLLFSLVVGVVAYIDSYMAIASGVNTILNPKNSAILVFQYTLALGFFVVLLFGAPIYAYLSFRRWINWRWVLILGILPGVLLLFVDMHFGRFGVVCGLVVASVSHYVCAKYHESLTSL